MLAKRGKKVFALALSVLMLVGMLPLSAIAAVSADDYLIESEGMATAAPASLEDGQVWTNKDVVDNGDGTFEVTLYAWGKDFPELNSEGTPTGARVNPLGADDPADKVVTITDIIGDGFELSGSFDAEAGNLAITGGTVVWEVAQKDIVGAAPATCTFTVSLADGWQIGRRYETNQAASAHFVPVRGNPYYWTKELVVEAVLELGDDPSWNDVGVNYFMVTDHSYTEGGQPLILEKTWGGNHKDGTSREYTIFGRTYQVFADIVDLGELLIGGVTYTKKYVFAILDFPTEGSNRTYEIYVDNNGGNGVTGAELFRTIITSVEYFEKSGMGWEENVVTVDLPNKGYIIITEKPRDVGPFDITVNKRITQTSDFATIPDDAYFTFTLYDPSGEVQDSASLTYAQYKDGTTEVTLTIPPSIHSSSAQVKTYTISEEIFGENWENNTQEFRIAVSGDGSYTIDGQSVNEVTFTNTYTEDPVGYLYVEKDWTGVPVALRSEIYFDLYKVGSDTPVAEDCVLNAEGNWRIPFSTADGGPIELGETYTVVESPVKHVYITTAEVGQATVSLVENDPNAVITIRNDYAVLYGTLTINKQWIHTDGTHNNAAYFDNDSKAVFVISGKALDGSEVETSLTLTAEDFVSGDAGSELWSESISLPRGTYTIQETITSDYVLTSGPIGKITVGAGEESITVVNEYRHPQGELTVKKVWVGGEPDMTIYADVTLDGLPFATDVALSAPEWSAVLPFDLPDDHAELFEFIVTEQNVPEGYTSDITYSGGAESVMLGWETRFGQALITNTKEAPLGSLTITKTWAPANGGDIGIPDSIVINVDPAPDGGDGSYVLSMNPAGKWELVIEDVPLGSYTITESAAAGDELFDMYTSSAPDGIEVPVAENNLNGEAAFVNALGSGYITLLKVWAIGDDYDPPNAANGVLVSVYGVSIEDPEAAPFEWEGRVYSDKAKVLKAPLGYTYSVTELSTFDYYETSYTVTQGEAVVEGSVFELTDADGGAIANVNIINTYEAPLGLLTVTKNFIGAETPAGGYTEVEFYLYEDGARVTDDSGADMIFTTDGHSYRFSTKGGEYMLKLGSRYAVEEIVPEDYALVSYAPSVAGSTRSGAVLVSKDDSDQEITITNTYIVPTGDLRVEKVWEDDGFRFNRPDVITVSLMRSTDENQTRVAVGSVELSDEKGWGYTFSGLPVYDDNGNQYTYYVSESGVDAQQYSATFTDEADGDISAIGIKLAKDGTRTVTVTNTADSSTILGTVTAVKEWKDVPEALQRSVSVMLYANGVAVGAARTLEADSWSTSWSVRILDEEGDPIEYSIVEITASEHWDWSASAAVTLDGDGTAKLTVTNTYVPYDEKGVELDKTGRSSIAVGGEAIIPYTLTIYNAGNKTMSDITVVDTFTSAGMSLVEGSVTGAAAAYDAAAGTITFTVSGSLAPGASAVITYRVKVTETGTYENTAVVEATVAGESDKVTDDDDDESNVTAPDLAIVKELVSRYDSVITSGSATFSYKLTVINNGAHDLINLVVTDTMIPSEAGATMIYSATDASFHAATKTWTISKLEAGATLELFYSVTVDSEGTYTNGAAVEGFFLDDDGAQKVMHARSEEVEVEVIRPTGGITLEKTGANVTLTDGEAIIPYTLTIENASSQTMTNIQVTDTFGTAGMALVEGSVTGATAVYDAAAGTITFTVDGSLASGASATITYRVKVTAVGTYLNAAVAEGTVPGVTEPLTDDADAESRVDAPYTPPGVRNTFTVTVEYYYGDTSIASDRTRNYTVTGNRYSYDVEDFLALTIGEYTLIDGAYQLTGSATADITIRLLYELPTTPITPDPDPGPGPGSDPGDGPGEEIVIIDEEVPLGDLPEEFEIIEEEVPLSNLPEFIPPEEFEIIDEEVPLGDLPQTGTTAIAAGSMGLFSAMSLLVAGLTLFGRKKKEEN